MIEFFVPGEPVAKGRPRFTTRGGFARAYTPAKTAEYESYVYGMAMAAMGARKPYKGPLSLSLTVTKRVPASWPKARRQAAIEHQIRPTGKPDADNYGKCLKDALNGVCWEDDAQVCDLWVRKFYGERPGVHVVISELAGTWA